MSIIFILLIFLIFACFTVEQNKENLQHTFSDIHYLGGQPLATASDIKYGTLYVSEDMISFWETDKNEYLFNIPMQEIINCTLETKESLTVGTIVDIFASGLQKNKQYIRIELKNGVSHFNNVIFYSSITPSAPIIKTINETRINFIINKRFEKGES